jgi:hypothetical protein
MKRISLLVCYVLISCLSFAQTIKNESIDNISIDYDNPASLIPSLQVTSFGNVAVRYQTKVISLLVYNGEGKEIECDMRMAAFKGGKIVELYQGYGYQKLANGRNAEPFFPCYITLPAGEYSFYPVVKMKGEKAWRIMGTFSSELDQPYMDSWKLNVLDSYDAPSSSSMIQLDAPGDQNAIKSMYTVFGYKVNESFRMQMTLHNTQSKVLSGRIKLVNKRDLKMFWRGCEYVPGDCSDEWTDCITYFANLNGIQADIDGTFRVRFNAGEERVCVFSNCQFPNYHDYNNRYAPNIVAMFLPDGKTDAPENWLLVNENAEFCYDSTGMLVDEVEYALNSQACYYKEAISIMPLELNKVDLKLNKLQSKIILSGITLYSNLKVINNGQSIPCQRMDESNVTFNVEKGNVYTVQLYNDKYSEVKNFKLKF